MPTNILWSAIRCRQRHQRKQARGAHPGHRQGDQLGQHESGQQQQGIAARHIQPRYSQQGRQQQASHGQQRVGAQHGSGATQQQLDRGLRLTQLLKQPQYRPMPLTDQVAVIFAGTNGLLDHIPVDRIGEWKEAFLRAYNTQFADIANQIQNEPGKWSDEIVGKLRQAIETFNASWN